MSVMVDGESDFEPTAFCTSGFAQPGVETCLEKTLNGSSLDKDDQAF
jgi:hypothetical protein